MSSNNDRPSIAPWRVASASDEIENGRVGSTASCQRSENQIFKRASWLPRALVKEVRQEAAKIDELSGRDVHFVIHLQEFNA